MEEKYFDPDYVSLEELYKDDDYEDDDYEDDDYWDELDERKIN